MLVTRPASDAAGHAAAASVASAVAAAVVPPDAVPAGSPWPAGALRTDQDVLVGGVGLSRLAARYATPLYVLDEAEVRSRCRAYRRALPGADVVYAAKAFLCGAMAEWVEQEGLGLDVCSGGELEHAVTCGFPAGRIVMHGNAKSPEELAAAVRLGVGRIVVDSFSEIARLAVLASPERPQDVLVRVVPGVSAGHHAAVRTGVEEQKFGFSIAAGDAADAVERVLNQPRLRLAGLHCHLGSQIAEVGPYLDTLDRVVPLLAAIRDRHGIALPELDLGGGHAVPYRAGESALDLAEFAERVNARLAELCARHRLAVPRLAVEPGRAVVGPAGVAVYRVLAVKHTMGGRTFVAVDGGMSDNPRPALYDARYTATLVGRAVAADAPLTDACVVGRHCEAGDVLVPEVRLPADIRAGDLVAVPVAGAYHLSMASGYNLVGRPPLVAVRDGASRMLLRRETLDDFRRRDIGR
ncbi:diaminopimelate decarboxylase [Streptacidiphilus albus]|uniref:diaminopimelate decarboxylase n=1 Tax=Streptacidiphilus albus TaxID=105425 RepID=UPI0009DDC07F|nr:diaminopimelate decarboxylase [Streptacidiphilus albus]